jgi:tripartite-type tricarboxylate transporter receptor subunit TctC
VPTFASKGFREVDIVGCPGRRTDKVKNLHDAFVAAFNTAEVKAAMAKQDNIIAPTTPEGAVAFLKSEQERYARLVKKADIKLD